MKRPDSGDSEELGCRNIGILVIDAWKFCWLIECKGGFMFAYTVEQCCI